MKPLVLGRGFSPGTGNQSISGVGGRGHGDMALLSPSRLPIGGCLFVQQTELLLQTQHVHLHTNLMCSHVHVVQVSF